MYRERLALIKLHKVQALAVCEDMEARSAADPQRIPLASFPVYPISNESAWWGQHVSSDGVERPPIAEQFEGRLVTRKGEFWVVLNGTRRGFPSYEAFLKMGFENDMAFPLTLAQVRAVPEGERLPPPPAGGGGTGPGAAAAGAAAGAGDSASPEGAIYQKMLGRGHRSGGGGGGGRRGRAGPASHDVDM